MDTTGDVGILAIIGTLISVIFVIAQLRQSVNQEIRELIAEYNMRYLSIAARIPMEILVDNKSLEELADDPSHDIRDIRRAIYDYFLLCEEQIRLANERTHRGSPRWARNIRIFSSGLIRDVKVWELAISEWEDGMRDNFKRTAVRQVFDQTSATLQSQDGDVPFSGLQGLQ